MSGDAFLEVLGPQLPDAGLRKWMAPGSVWDTAKAWSLRV